MKKWWLKTWSKIRAVFYSVLVGLGIIAAPAITTAGPVHFTYTPATQRADGTALPAVEIAFTRLYCGGVLLIEEPGADGDFDPDLPAGVHVCDATHVDTDGQESDRSNPVTKIVLPALPGAPDNLGA